MNPLLQLIKARLQNSINSKNRARLTNLSPSIIASNCTGGFLYHWLGLKFYSPFINLYLSPEDFIKALEYFDDFIQSDITEYTEGDFDYPVGIGFKGIIVHFMHYDTFASAYEKWNIRKKRINKNNMVIFLSNWGVTMINLNYLIVCHIKTKLYSLTKIILK